VDALHVNPDREGGAAGLSTTFLKPLARRHAAACQFDDTLPEGLCGLDESACSDTMLLIYNVYVVQWSMACVYVFLLRAPVIYQSSSSGKYLLMRLI